MDLRGKLPTRPGAAPYLRRSPIEMAAVKWLVFHHTGLLDARPTADAVARYQTGPEPRDPYPAIAYHLYVEADGTIEVCHDLETVCWSQGDGSPGQKDGVGLNNWWGVACCFAGNNPNPAQLQAMQRVGPALDTVVGRRLERTAHCLVSQANGKPLTECPGPFWRQWLPIVQRG